MLKLVRIKPKSRKEKAMEKTEDCGLGVEALAQQKDFLLLHWVGED